MKAFKRLFKRKKKREQGSSASDGGGPPKAPKPILKSQRPAVPPVPTQQSPPHNHSATGVPHAAGTDYAAKWRKDPQPVPAPVMKREEPRAVSPLPPPSPMTPNDPVHRNGGPSFPPKQREPATGVPAKEPDNPPKVEESSSEHPDQGGKSAYGVSDTFKGLSPAQRFDISETNQTGDAQQLGKLGDAYDSIPLIEQLKLPRGGISMETKAVGRIQFGIPPETIKDSMVLGIPVPQVYIVPAERFCREMGPALGVNLAEFEFPAYFNFFVSKKRCTLVVDSQEAQENICRVFNETLLGPSHFRREKDPIQFAEEDFSSDFPKDAIPNLEKELRYFRIMPDGKELDVDVLLEFSQFKMPGEGFFHENLGVPPHLAGSTEMDEFEEMDEEELDEALQMVGDEETGEEEEVPSDEQGVERRASSKWSYKKARWVGDVATVWPANATEQQKLDCSVPRVEVFKMPSGTEYIIHDIDVNNVIVGKARFSGHVKVSEQMSVEGFGGRSFMDDVAPSEQPKGKEGGEDDDSYDVDLESSPMIPQAPPTFHPPSFGLTTLGNSHGFDKSGSVSGYVLWVNGRGIMIDPPPYSSATLEREGIRPRTIVGIILTHCHADHDAGAFQKVLTGSPVVVITTPTIYKSFIRKYAALASLSPSLLRHSHRYKPAIIGEPLRFQGATFHFTYSLHAIPCVGFRVEWRGRSMVFTGDHMNKPDEIDRLQTEGVLSKARADDLRNLPLQETDLLLHEAGAPPIHTPLEVLMKLPQRVKKRLYVVHTSNIPEKYDLRVAPTGTAGTLRLDQFQRGGPGAGIATSTWMERSVMRQKNTRDAYSISLEDDNILPSPWSSASNEYSAINEESATPDPRTLNTSIVNMTQSGSQRPSLGGGGMGASNVPLVSLRPASSTDAWFILNLLSAVPFLSSLAYSSTMEVLETARVDAYCKNDVVVPAARRSQLLCVVWEGTCVERAKSESTRAKKGEPNLSTIDEMDIASPRGAVWHAGDWTGPLVLQPEKRLSGESEISSTHDIVAMSNEGVKVITVDFSSLHQILRSGSQLYTKYLDRSQQQQRRLSLEVASQGSPSSTVTQQLLTEALRNLNVLELLDQNSALRKLSAVQKRHLESLAEGPVAFGPAEKLWRSGAPVDKGFLIISGNASFVTRRRNAGSASVPAAHMVLTPSTRNMLSRLSDGSQAVGASNVGEEMKKDVMQAVMEMEESPDEPKRETKPEDQVQLESLFSRAGDGQAKSMTEAHDFVKLSRNLQKRAEILSGDPTSDVSIGSSHDDSASNDSDHFSEEMGTGISAGVPSSSGGKRRNSLSRRRSSRARFANKVLGRLYSRRAFTGGLVFSRGHFLGDVSKMVAGLLSSDYDHDHASLDSSMPAYGFGDKAEGTMEPISENLTEMVIQEQEGENHVVHTSTLTAGMDGCVVLVFPKENLIPFLDEYPGLLLSLLGTQVVV